MRAVVVRRYGPPEEAGLAELPEPVPGPDEVLVQVQASGVTAASARMRAGQFPRGFHLPGRLALGLARPRRPVQYGPLSGVVRSVGDRVTRWQPGDRVAGYSAAAQAELATVPAADLARVPDAVRHEDAAAVIFGGATALHYLHTRAALQPGETVLVNGGAGGVGTMAVQIATLLGGVVTTVTSAANRELMDRLGATHAVDYETTPVTRLAERFDLVVDAVGNLDPTSGKSRATATGRVVLLVAGLPDLLRARGRVLAGPAAEKPADYARLFEWLERGELDPVLTTIGPEEIVAAHRRIDSGRKVGNLALVW